MTILKIGGTGITSRNGLVKSGTYVDRGEDRQQEHVIIFLNWNIPYIGTASGSLPY